MTNDIFFFTDDDDLNEALNIEKENTKISPLDFSGDAINGDCCQINDTTYKVPKAITLDDLDLFYSF